MITRENYFYELLVRMSVPGGEVQGFQVRNAECMVEDGVILTQAIGIAQPSSATQLATLLTTADLQQIVTAFQAEIDARP